MQVLLKLFVLRLTVFKHSLEVKPRVCGVKIGRLFLTCVQMVDIVVVIVSFALDVVIAVKSVAGSSACFHFSSNLNPCSEKALVAETSVLVVLRLWRFARIVNGTGRGRTQGRVFTGLMFFRTCARLWRVAVAVTVHAKWEEKKHVLTEKIAHLEARVIKLEYLLAAEPLPEPIQALVDKVLAPALESASTTATPATEGLALQPRTDGATRDHFSAAGEGKNGSAAPTAGARATNMATPAEQDGNAATEVTPFRASEAGSVAPHLVDAVESDSPPKLRVTPL